MQNTLARLLGMNLEQVARSEFVLSLNEQPAIEKIEDRIYMALRISGVCFDAEASDCKIAAIFLYADGYEDYKGFAGTLPEGIAFSMSRRLLQKQLGVPSASGCGNMILFYGKAPAWDRFDRNEYSLHIQYDDDEASINLVTIMRPEFIPN